MLDTDQITSGLAHVLASPGDEGSLELIVIRPKAGGREAFVSPEGGVEGDRWSGARGRLLPGRRPDPRSQVSLMKARLLRLISGGDERRMLLAGDNLIVDFDLSEDNVGAGRRLAVGGAVLEVTDVAHNGCGAFTSRYGRDAVKFVNSAEGKRLHLRGLYARVVEAGVVCVGDAVRKV